MDIESKAKKLYLAVGVPVGVIGSLLTIAGANYLEHKGGAKN